MTIFIVFIVITITITLYVSAKTTPKNDKCDLINEQREIHDGENDVKMRDNVSQAKLG